MHGQNTPPPPRSGSSARQEAQKVTSARLVSAEADGLRSAAAVSAPAPSHAEPPYAYGPYQIQKRIGSGGMAEVFLARRSGVAGFAKTVVIKRLQPRFLRDENFVRMFIEEAKLAAQVQHKNVVQVYELDNMDGEFYMAMEYVEGIDLKRLLRTASHSGRRVPPWLSVHVVCEVLEALAYAHELRDEQGRRRNIVHCDVTPENIFLSNQGDIKLGDFGVANDDTRAVDPFPNQIKGKIPYMSPEQVSGQRPDHRSDVFAAGIVLWELLAQRRLFSAPTPAEIMSHICVAPRQPPSRLHPDVPPALDALVLAALEPDLERRVASARELQRQLLQISLQLRPRVSLPDVREALEALLAPEEEKSADLAIDITTDLSLERAPVAPAPAVAAGPVATSRELTPELFDLEQALMQESALADVPRTTSEDEPTERGYIDEGLEVLLEGEDGPRIGSKILAPEAALPPAVAHGTPSSDGAQPLKDAFTYAIIKPRHAVDELGTPPRIPMPGSPAKVETADVIKRRQQAVAPMPAKPGTVETRDVLRQSPFTGSPSRLPSPSASRIPASSPDQGPRFWLRRRGSAPMGPLETDAVLAELELRLDDGGRESLEVSTDGFRWMDLETWAELLGEEVVARDPALPRTEFSGTLKAFSLSAVFGHLARTKQSGRLVLLRYGDRGVERRELHLDGGRLVNVCSSHDLLRSWIQLTRDPRVPPDELTAVLHRSLREGVPAAELLSPQLEGLLRSSRARLMQAALQQTCTWSTAHFGFDVHAPVLPAPGSPLGLLRLLPGLISRAKSSKELRADLDKVMHVPLDRSERFDDEVAAMALRPVALERLAPFGHGYTLLESIAQSGGLADEKLPLVLGYLLLELGLLRPRSRVGSPR